MTTCLTWSDLDDYFGGLCTTRLKLETPPSNAKTSNCEVCVTPKETFGVCSACATAPPATYKATVTYSSGTAACCPDYNGTFYLYTSAPCVWSSLELEKYLVLAGSLGTNNLRTECSNRTNARPRFVLRAFQFFRQGVPRVRWRLELNYATPCGINGGTGQVSSYAQFDMPNNNCNAPASLVRSGGAGGCAPTQSTLFFPFPCGVGDAINGTPIAFSATIEPL